MKKNDKRKNNPGRPKINAEPTVPIRVPASLAKNLTKQRIAELTQLFELNLWNYCTDILDRAKESKEGYE